MLFYGNFLYFLFIPFSFYPMTAVFQKQCDNAVVNQTVIKDAR